MNRDQRFHIVYPREAYVDGAQLIRWAKDDIANGESAIADRPEDITSVEDAIAVLHDSGTVTVSSTPES